MKLNMDFIKYFSCIVLAIIFMSQDTTTQEIVCGTEIDNVLEAMCIHGYNNLPLPKRKKSQSPSPYGLIGTDSNIDMGPSPFLYGELVHAIAKTRRRRQGVYYECCRKGCTLHELEMFCNDPE